MTYKPKHDKYIVSNPYNIPVHDQGSKNNCTAHAVALSLEYQLSNKFKERTLINVDDLWNKQKGLGTATEENGDTLVGPYIIAEKYGVNFQTDSGRKGVFFLNGKIYWSNDIRYALHILRIKLLCAFHKN